MNKKQTLSVVLATYNEEKNLASCLNSVKDLADEIVIVDGTSSDKTVEIAKKYGAIIKITTNKPNFHINKQMAIDMATKDWILQLDGDEHVSPELKDEIIEILDEENRQSSIVNHKSDVNGYWMPRKNWFLGRFLMKGGQYPDYTLRFYRNGKGRLPQKDVHEQAQVEGKVGYLKNALLHYPYKNFRHYLNKWNRYNILFAEQIREEQSKKNIFQKIFYAFGYLIAKPGHWFLTTYFRHKGFVDSWQGFTFSLFSALRFPTSYLKYLGWYKILVILILFFSVVLRFYNFPDRWGLGGDDGRDAMIGLEAIKRHELPLMGPFSSAGPFVFGGIFYWFIALSYLVLPFLIYAPYLFIGILSVIIVATLIYMGKLLIDEKFSLIIGVLAAVSPQLIIRSLALGPHTFIAFLAPFAIVNYLLLWQRKKLIFAFLMGISLGLALSMHYQAINLLIFLPAVFFVSTLSFKERLKAFALVLFGFIIPSLPLLYWDMHQNFANINNILDYLLIAQYRLYVPNSWSLFLFKYIPSYWSFVVGNFSQVGLVLFISSTLLFLYSVFKRTINKQFLVLGIIFFILLGVNKFYKGERSEGYLLYLLPFVLIFSSFLIYKLFGFKQKAVRLISGLLVILIIGFNFFPILQSLNYKTSVKEFYEVSNYLSKKYPNTKFSIYDYKYNLYTSSMPLSLIMGFQGKIDANGKKIGVSCIGKGCPNNPPTITKDFLVIVDLQNVKKADFNKNNQVWVNVNQASVYDDLIGWLNKNQLKSPFSLKNYIIERVYPFK